MSGWEQVRVPQIYQKWAEPCALILASFGAFGAQLVAFSPGFPGSPTIAAAETIVLIAGTWQAGDAESQ